MSTAAWYNSAAIVPLGIFSAMLAASCALLVNCGRAGGARNAVSALGIGWSHHEAVRFATVGTILFFYVIGLVPRVDFIIASGLLITALTFGFYKGRRRRMVLGAAAVAICGCYALIAHLPQSQWGRHDDGAVTSAVWVPLTVGMLLVAKGDRVLKLCPIVAVVAPFVLVCAMAFGFRQNVPNRGGPIFRQIEYQYYVSLRPLWSY